MINTDAIRTQLADPWKVAQLLGLKYRAGKVCCPVHGEKNPSCSFNNRDGALVFFCHSCGAHGDVFQLVMAVKECSFREAGVFLSELTNTGEADDDWEPTPPPPEPPPRYPDQSARDLWRRSSPVGDTLEHRMGGVGLPEWSARLLPEGPLPTWAERWRNTGHTVIVPQFDHRGEMRTLIGRRPFNGCDDLPKSMTPSGWSIKGVGPINAAFRTMIRERHHGPRAVIITEGEIDFLLANANWAHVPILCVRSGTLTPDWSTTIPKGSRVLVATDLDPAGHRYADKVLDTFKDRDIRFRRWVAPDGVTDLGELSDLQGGLFNLQSKEFK